MKAYPNEKLYAIAEENYSILRNYCEMLLQEGYWEDPQGILNQQIHDFLALYIQAMLVQVADYIGAGDGETLRMIIGITGSNPLAIDMEIGITERSVEEAKKCVSAPPILLQLCSLRDVEHQSSIAGLFFDAVLNIIFAMAYLNSKNEAAITRYVREYYARVRFFIQNGQGYGCVDEAYLFHKICNGDLLTNTALLKEVGEDFALYKKEAFLLEEKKEVKLSAAGGATAADVQDGSEDDPTDSGDGYGYSEDEEYEEEYLEEEYEFEDEFVCAEEEDEETEEEELRERSEKNELKENKELEKNSLDKELEKSSLNKGSEKNGSREDQETKDKELGRDGEIEPELEEDQADRKKLEEESAVTVLSAAQLLRSDRKGNLPQNNSPSSTTEKKTQNISYSPVTEQKIQNNSPSPITEQKVQNNLSSSTTEQKTQNISSSSAAEQREVSEISAQKEQQKLEVDKEAATRAALASFKAKRMEKLMNRLDELVGLSGVKEEIHSLINLIRVRKMREEYHLPGMPMSYHMVFTGSPGTGKTTVARLVGEIYRELGILSKGMMIETDRAGLVAGYVGQTAIKVKEVVEKAKGGILFIDEAYTLSNAVGGNDFGTEAIDMLVKMMEDYREDLVIIVAGYTKEMQTFLKSNTGLISRFNKFIDFPDYQDEELVDILNGMATRAGFSLAEEVLEAVRGYLSRLTPPQRGDFGNARGIRNLFEKMVAAQANRVVCYGQPTKEQLSSITFEDCKFFA